METCTRLLLFSSTEEFYYALAITCWSRAWLIKRLIPANVQPVFLWWLLGPQSFPYVWSINVICFRINSRFFRKKKTILLGRVVTLSVAAVLGEMASILSSMFHRPSIHFPSKYLSKCIYVPRTNEVTIIEDDLVILANLVKIEFLSHIQVSVACP